ncbi:response regulator transcription factor [Pseudoalteromonas sp. T1lg65]|uniref:helix-turn-helix transcriptional regulator n=1 Tax=Pseudoalteromonas sp. T1lg65 TaxID=2077101 RepID=UPI003F794B44
MSTRNLQHNQHQLYQQSIFMLTHPTVDTSCPEFSLLLRVLETVSQQVKVDDKLPCDTQRSAFSLFLVDVSLRDCNELLSAEILHLAQKHRVLLFNARPEKVNEKTALLGNVKGLIYVDTPPETLFKAVRTVLNNELWFCRSAISEAFSELITLLPKPCVMSDPNLQDERLNSLTTREKSVIRLLATGARNEDIADSLNISAHTVKTHIYSAFKKTNSRNRIELANWAQQHIPLTSAR